MKILNNVAEVLSLNEGLASFISASCPWIYDNWNPEQIGHIFVLDEEDLEYARCLPISPHAMTLDLEEFNMWEGEAIHDQGYWNVVGIVGQEFGFVLFLSNSIVQLLPNFKRNINRSIS